MNALQVQAAAGQATTMYRRNATGQIVTQDGNRDHYITKVPQGRYRLQLTGISDTFQMTNNFRESSSDPELQDMRRWEFTILNGKNLNGRVFGLLFTDRYGPKSNAAKVIHGIRGFEVEPNEAIDLSAYIGYPGHAGDGRGVLVCYIEHTQNGNPKIGSVEPPEEPDPRYATRPGVTLAPDEPPTDAGAAEDDPFAEQEEDF